MLRGTLPSGRRVRLPGRRSVATHQQREVHAVHDRVCNDGSRQAPSRFEEPAEEEAEPPSAESGARLWVESVCPEIRTGLAPVLKSAGSADAIQFLDRFLEHLPDAGLEGYIRALADRNALAREWATFQTRYPIVLGPVCTDPAFPVGRDLEADAIGDLLRAMRLVVTVNLLGLPAAAVPVGVIGGLPQGVQLIGDRFREDLCLDAAEAIERAIGTLTPIDPR